MQIHNKHFDVITLGNNLAAYLFAFNLVGKGKRVLLLKSPDLRQGHAWSRELGFFSLALLKSWGKEHNTLPLINIDSYVKIRPTLLVGKQHKVLLGAKTSDNLREIYRKFGHFLPTLEKSEIEASADSIEESILQIAQLLVKTDLKKAHDLKEIKVKKLLEMLPPFIGKLFKLFSDNESIKNNESLEELIHIGQAGFNYVLHTEMDDWKCFHYLMDLLLPRFQLDEDKLLADLDQCFVDHNFFKSSAKILDWQIDRQTLFSIQLDSYEGLIYGKDFYFISALPLLPFVFEKKMLSDNDIYSAAFIEVEAPSLSNVFSFWQGHRFLVSSYNDIGTEHPLREYYFLDNGTCLAKVLRSFNTGVKQEFFYDKIHQLIKNDLRQHVLSCSEGDDSCFTFRLLDMNEVSDFWSRPNPLIKQKIKEQKSNKSLFFFKRNNPKLFINHPCFLLNESGDKLSNVYYQGPLIENCSLHGLNGHLLHSFLFS